MTGGEAMDVDGQAPSGRQLHVGNQALAVRWRWRWRWRWHGGRARRAPTQGCLAPSCAPCGRPLLPSPPPLPQVPREGMEVASPWRDGLLADWELVEGLLAHTFRWAAGSHCRCRRCQQQRWQQHEACWC